MCVCLCVCVCVRACVRACAPSDQDVFSGQLLIHQSLLSHQHAQFPGSLRPQGQCTIYPLYTSSIYILYILCLPGQYRCSWLNHWYNAVKPQLAVSFVKSICRERAPAMNVGNSSSTLVCMVSPCQEIHCLLYFPPQTVPRTLYCQAWYDSRIRKRDIGDGLN